MSTFSQVALVVDTLVELPQGAPDNLFESNRLSGLPVELGTQKSNYFVIGT